MSTLENVSGEETAEDARSLAQHLNALRGEELYAPIWAEDPNCRKHSVALKLLELSSSELHNREMVNWRRARSVIEHENNLVNHRITWLLTSQASLLAAAGYLLAQQNHLFLLLLIAFLGNCLSFNLFVQLRNAKVQIQRVTEWWYDQAFSNKEQSDRKTAYEALNRRNPSLHFWPHVEEVLARTTLSNWAVFRPEAMPFYFISAWIGLIAWVITPPDLQISLLGKSSRLWQYLMNTTVPVGGVLLLLMILTACVMLIQNWRQWSKDK